MRSTHGSAVEDALMIPLMLGYGPYIVVMVMVRYITPTAASKSKGLEGEGLGDVCDEGEEGVDVGDF